MAATDTLLETHEEEAITTTIEPEAVVEQATNANVTKLEALMRKTLQLRLNARAAQQKLRDIELELGRADSEKRGRFERMQQAALVEYRKVRSEAIRARHQLVSNLRMLPSRS